MRYLAIVAVLFVGGCATTNITERAKQIQGYTKLACAFVPTLGTIANILSSGVTAPASVIANEICAAVTTAPLADGPRRGPARAYGVEIKGKFVGRGQ